MDSNTLFSIFFILLILGIFYALFRRRQADDSDGELSILEYGQLLLQADQTARILVRGIQEEWRNGTIEDDQRTHEAVKQLKELYPQIDDKELIRIVKSAVYLLRLGAGKQVDKVLENVPEIPKTPFGMVDETILKFHVGEPFTQDLNLLTQSGGVLQVRNSQWGGEMLAQSSGGVLHTNLLG